MCIYISLSRLNKRYIKYMFFLKTVNLFFNLENGDRSRVQNAIVRKEKHFENNNEVDGTVTMLSCPWRIVPPQDARFGGFCGAVDVRARFRGNQTSALGRKLLGNSILVFSLRALCRFELEPDSRHSRGMARPRNVSLSLVGFLKH